MLGFCKIMLVGDKIRSNFLGLYPPLPTTTRSGGRECHHYMLWYHFKILQNLSTSYPQGYPQVIHRVKALKLLRKGLFKRVINNNYYYYKGKVKVNGIESGVPPLGRSALTPQPRKIKNFAGLI